MRRGYTSGENCAGIRCRKFHSNVARRGGKFDSDLPRRRPKVDANVTRRGGRKVIPTWQGVEEEILIPLRRLDKETGLRVTVTLLA